MGLSKGCNHLNCPFRISNLEFYDESNFSHKFSQFGLTEHVPCQSGSFQTPKFYQHDLFW